MINPLRILLLISAAVALVACFDTDAEMEVKEDGAVTISSEIILTKRMYNLANRAYGNEEFLKKRCEETGGVFDPDISHVNCKVDLDTSIDELLAGDVQAKNASLPLDLSTLTLVDNGDGTYSMDYEIDWGLAEDAMDMEDAAGAVEEAAENQQEAAEAAEDAAKDEDPQTDATEAAADEAGEAADEAKDTADDAKKTERLISNYLDGYTVSLTFKAPKILDGNGEMHGDDEMTMDIDMGDIDEGEAELPETFSVTFSTSAE